MGRSFFLGALSGAIGLIAIVGVSLIVFLSRGVDAGVSTAASLERAEFRGLYTPERLEAGRTRIALEDPRVIQRFLTGGIFGNPASRLAGLHMFSRDEAVTEDIRRKTERIEVAPSTWLVRFPIVNAVFFETEEGVVVVDTGMAAAGPVLLEHIREVTDRPIASTIITHGHVDHLTGVWALEEDENTFAIPIYANAKMIDRVQRYRDLRGSISKYMSQPYDEVPGDLNVADLIDYDVSEETRIWFGNESLIMVPHRGETDDQLYVWSPERKILVAADYYQGFLPNLGNGKRVQRYGSEWIAALREMAELGAEIMLPMHGQAIIGEEAVREALTLHADALEHIENEVKAGLNAGLRKDEVVDAITWPEKFVNDPRLDTYYVSPQDVAKMYIKQWTGWWDDQPAHWTPATLESQARQIVALAGGLERFLAEAEVIADIDIVMASHMADWAFFARPDDKRAQDYAIAVYRKRLLDPDVPEQEALAYFDHIALIRGLQLEASEAAGFVK